MQRPPMIFTLDTETRGLSGEIFRVGLYNGKDYFVANQFDEIKEIMISYSVAYDVHIYIHNLDFDLSKIVKQLQGEIIFKDSLFINNRAVTVATESFILHDSYSLLTGSLEKLCRDFEIEEGKLDFLDELIQTGNDRYFIYDVFKREMTSDHRSVITRIDPVINVKESKGNFFCNVDPDDELLNRYLKYDCIGLYKLIEKTIAISGLSIESFLKCPTTASLSMRVFKENYSDQYDLACLTRYTGSGRVDEWFLRSGYYGGRTEVFIPVMNKGYHYDVNSLYPHCMKENEFPIGYYDRESGSKAQKLFSYWRKTRKGSGFIHAKVEVPKMNIPPLPKRDDKIGKLIFPVGMLEGVWTFHELEMSLKYGVVIHEIVEVMYYKKTANLFESYVSYFEEIKNTSTGAKRIFAKLMLNSLYGKFGTQRERDTFIDYSDQEFYDLQVKERETDHHRLTKMNVRKIKFFRINQDVIRYTKELESRYIQVQLSAYVTSYARILLYETMKEIERKGGKIAYCDTDSIVTDRPIDPDLVDPIQFGKWQLEKEIDVGYFLQPKLYYEQSGEKETKKGKGIPKSELNKWNKYFYEYVLQSIIEDQESIPIYRDLDGRNKFISALKRDKDFDEILKLTKAINLRTIQKRKMDYKKNKSDPHEVHDHGKKFDSTEYVTYYESLKKENQAIADQTDFYELKNAIKTHGKIRTILQGEKYYREFLEMSRSVKVKFFSALGIEIDEFCSYSGIEVNDLVEQLRTT